MLENYDQESIRKAMTLAAVTGLRNALGPALLAVSENDESKSVYAAAAAAEMVIDKIPFMPSRASLPLLIPRALGGAYVARRVLGKNDPWAAALGAVVSAGVASLAPRVRALVRTTLGVPDSLIGLAEDYLALKYGAEAVGLHPGELLEKSGLSETFESLRASVTDQSQGDSPNPAFYRPPAGSPAAY